MGVFGGWKGVVMLLLCSLRDPCLPYSMTHSTAFNIDLESLSSHAKRLYI